MEKHHKRKKAASFIDSVISDIENATLFKLAAKAFRSWYTNWPWILLAVLVDTIFLIALSSTITIIQFTLFEHLEALMSMAGEATGGLMNIYNQTAAVSSGLAGMATTYDFQYHLTIIFKYVGLMILLVFIYWIVFQGISWYISYRMSTKDRMPFLVFMKNFAIQSLPFYAVTIFWIFLSIRVLFSIKTSIAPLFSQDFLNFVFIILVMVTWYFGSLCYTLTSKSSWNNFKQSFTYGLRSFSKTIQSFLLILVLFLIIDQFLRLGFIRQDPFILMIVGTIVFMPTLVFAKILLFKTTAEYWKK